MNGEERRHRRGEDRGEDEERPAVKVTDRRRVRPDGADASSAAGGQEPPSRTVQDEGTTTLDSQVDEDPVAAARREAQEYRDHLQRLQAEFDNYRKRVLKEQTRAVELAAEPLIRRLLEVLDEFDLALMAAEQKPDFDRFLHGVELVYAKLQDILRSEGLHKIEAKGRPFDPAHHEVLLQSGEGEGEPVVTDVLRQGYTMKGRVLRPAGVKVVRK